MCIRLANIVANFKKTISKFDKPKMEAQAAEKVVSSFKGNVTNTNPLVMDAKATLSGIKATKSINEKRYQMFKDILDSKVLKFISEQYTQTYKKINPISKSNINAVKICILNVLDVSNLELTSEAQDLIKKIKRCKNPDELFLMFKNGDCMKVMQLNANKELKAYAKEAKITYSKDITSEHEAKFAEMMKNHNKKLPTFIEAFTPKSTKSEVIKIEQELNTMGIENVNLSDDLEQAKLVKEAMQNLLDAKIKLPTSITITPLLPKDISGCAINYVENMIQKRYVFLPMGEELVNLYSKNDSIDKVTKTFFFDGYPFEYQKKYVENAYQNYFKLKQSTSNPKHGIYHEVRHTLEHNTWREASKQLNDSEKRIAEGLSDYAQNSISEFKSEAFAKLMNGEKLTDEQMKLYMKFDGGILPQFS